MSIQLLIRVLRSYIRLIIIKLLHHSSFSFDTIAFLGTSVQVKVGRGKLRLGKAVYLESRCLISTASGGRMSIGKRTFFNRNCYIACRDSITIGSDCIFGPNVSIYDHNHKFDAIQVYKNEYRTDPIVIGNGCWIGDGVKILKGTVIGDGCVVSAGSVIQGVIPPRSLVNSKKELKIEALR